MSTAATTPAAARAASAGQSLARHAAVFTRQPSARLLGAYLALAVAARAALGDWSRGDAVVVAGFLAAQPFVEWIIHVFVLHFRPVTVFGRRVDLAVAESHRRHHRDPRNLRYVFIHRYALLIGGPVAVVLYHLVMPTRPLAATAAVMSTTLTLAYEWTHYLIHTDYVPRRAPYRRIHRAHRLHHFKNERYWYGVTSTFADHVLRTFPERDAVPTSPTARTLGSPAA